MPLIPEETIERVKAATDIVEVAGPVQLVLEGDEVDRLTPLVETDHLVEHAPVGVPKEVVGVD